MQHFLDINNELYKENQILKKALAYQEEKVFKLEQWKQSAENNLYRLNKIIDENNRDNRNFKK